MKVGFEYVPNSKRHIDIFLSPVSVLYYNVGHSDLTLVKDKQPETLTSLETIIREAWFLWFQNYVWFNNTPCRNVAYI